MTSSSGDGGISHDSMTTGVCVCVCVCLGVYTEECKSGLSFGSTLVALDIRASRTTYRDEFIDSCI